jgi:cyclopropane-fatty-acyl-phospholipid synthase
MSLLRTAIRLGEELPWPDGNSAAVIDRLVEQTRRKLGHFQNHSGENFLRAIATLPIAIKTSLLLQNSAP